MYNKSASSKQFDKMPVTASTRFFSRAAFTLVEVLIGAAALTLFMGGLFSLYSGGQKLGSQSFWTQQTVNRLRNACRHISDNVKKSSYPSTIIYPGQVIENTTNDFRLKYNSKETMCATEAASVDGAANPGTYLFQFAESTPERQQFDADTPGTIRYHIYSLSREGKLLYHLYAENAVVTVTPDYVKALNRATFPPAAAVLERNMIIAEDVEFVSVKAQQENVVSPLTISIACRYPRGETRRIEESTAVPNVANLKQASGAGTW